MRPSIIPSAELLAQARELDGVHGSIVTDYVQSKVTGLRYPNLDVLVIAQEHDYCMDALPLGLTALAASPRTTGVVAEYFLPELEQNFQRSMLDGLWGDKNTYPYLVEHDSRLIFSRRLTDVCRDSHKTVIVADAANKPEYYLSHNALALMLSVFPIGAFIGLFIPGPLLPLSLLGTGYLLNWMQNRHDRDNDSGMFDRYKIHRTDLIKLDPEDARRLFLAEGIEAVANGYCGEHRGQVIVPYPRAHAMRLVDHLTDDNAVRSAIKDAKAKLYHLYPGLEKAVRSYEWTDGIEGGYWKMVSRQPI